MAGGRALSGAERSKRWRENQKLLASGARPVADHAAPASPPASSPPSSAPTHSTEPVNVAGPADFAAVPELPGVDGGKSEPFAPPPPPAEPPPPVTESDVQLFAMGVVGYWQIGKAALAIKHPELVELANELPAPMREGMAKFDGALYQAAVRVGIKYGLRVPYGDELLCIGAIGLASYGLFGKVDPNAPQVVSGPPPNARRADAAPSSAPTRPSSATSSSPPKPSGPPGPLPDTSSQPWRLDG